MEGRDLENFRKKTKIFQRSKNAQKRSKVFKHVLNMFWGNFFEKKIAQCTMEGHDLEIFLKKSGIFKNSKKAQKRS